VAIFAVRDLRDKEASQNFGGTVLPQLPPEQQIWMIDSLAVRKDPAACSAIATALPRPRNGARPPLRHSGGSAIRSLPAPWPRHWPS
jgi:hypothetical protein